MDEEPQDNMDWQLLQFFIKIMRTVFVGMCWMLINIFFGLYLGYADPEESTPLKLFLFYSWLALSLAGFVYYIWRVWRHKMPPP